MGLYVYYFQPHRWNVLYNCSLYNVNSIPLAQRQNRSFAVVLGSLTIIYELMYIPCMYAMLRPHLRNRFCYKLLISMATLEMLNMPVTGFFSATFSWNGWMFCSFPRAQYFAGCMCLSAWVSYCVVCLVLAINRYSFITKQWCWLFSTHDREFIWLSLGPIAFVGLYVFAHPLFYSPMLGAWTLNPHTNFIGSAGGGSRLVNNIIFATTVPLIYIIFFIKHRSLLNLSAPRQFHGPDAQVVIINCTMALESISYLLMQHIHLPSWATAGSHVVWLTLQGSPPFVYLTMNSAVRRVVFRRNSISVRKVQMYEPTARKLSRRNSNTSSF